MVLVNSIAFSNLSERMDIDSNKKKVTDRFASAKAIPTYLVTDFGEVPSWSIWSGDDEFDVLLAVAESEPEAWFLASNSHFVGGQC